MTRPTLTQVMVHTLLAHHVADLGRLAAKTGVARTTLLAWSQGAAAATLADLARVAAAVGADPAALLGADPTADARRLDHQPGWDTFVAREAQEASGYFTERDLAALGAVVLPRPLRAPADPLDVRSLGEAVRELLARDAVPADDATPEVRSAIVTRRT